MAQTCVSGGGPPEANPETRSREALHWGMTPPWDMKQRRKAASGGYVLQPVTLQQVLELIPQGLAASGEHEPLMMTQTEERGSCGIYPPPPVGHGLRAALQGETTALKPSASRWMLSGWSSRSVGANDEGGHSLSAKTSASHTTPDGSQLAPVPTP